jgi:hypothetical protein
MRQYCECERDAEHINVITSKQPGVCDRGRAQWLLHGYDAPVQQQSREPLASPTGTLVTAIGSSALGIATLVPVLRHNMDTSIKLGITANNNT